MANYTNFFETLKESIARLRSTIVMYDGDPYYVLGITDHKKDGIFRVYLDPIGTGCKSRPNIYSILEDYGPEHPSLGQVFDNWIDANPGTEIIRKQMNSPLFNKFRPFPLGMMNSGNGVLYCERQPLRPKMEQGLTPGMVTVTTVGLDGSGRAGRFDQFSQAFRACTKGDHPSAKECLAALNSGEYANEALAFHREFALVLGPVGLVFLAYRTDIVGVLPKGDFSYIKLDPKFNHVKEVVAGLSLFGNYI